MRHLLCSFAAGGQSFRLYPFWCVLCCVRVSCSPGGCLFSSWGFFILCFPSISLIQMAKVDTSFCLVGDIVPDISLENVAKAASLNEAGLSAVVSAGVLSLEEGGSSCKVSVEKQERVGSRMMARVRFAGSSVMVLTAVRLVFQVGFLCFFDKERTSKYFTDTGLWPQVAKMIVKGKEAYQSSVLQSMNPPLPACVGLFETRVVGLKTDRDHMWDFALGVRRCLLGKECSADMRDICKYATPPPKFINE
jgi:hypothetical protein